MTLHEKLLAIQSDLKAPKENRSPMGYSYRSCEDILEAVKPLLKQQGVTLTLSDSIEMIGARFYVKATAMLSMPSASGDSLQSQHVFVTAYAREEEEKKGSDAAKITGAASSYARKYALNGLFCIDDTKDADAMNDHGKEPPRVAAKFTTPAPKAAPPSQTAAPKSPAPKKQPTLTQVMETLTACTAENAATLAYDAAKKYPWSDHDRNTIDECYLNVKAKFTKQAEKEMADAERSGMAA